MFTNQSLVHKQSLLVDMDPVIPNLWTDKFYDSE